jgi:LuxR family maltose regulon positive regulatory protein
MWVAQGRLTKALEWVREQDLSIDVAPSYLREFEHVTLARVLIARYKSDRDTGSIHEAIGLLDRLLQAAEEGGRMGSVIEILALLALAHAAQGDIPLALVSLERALTLAEPEGYVRLFVDEGEPLRMLIADFRFSIEKQMSSSAHAQLGYTGKLLAAFAPPVNKQSTIKNPKSEMVEPLSERELEVLKLLRTELSGPEIAGHLVISPNTFRTHTKNIFSKLGVNNRRAAVRRAEELDLI